ncbi:hypothetical protein ColLi_08002 [Colletotrichum liriopes]|uniref:Uncharacterized protein n=1 Tax=Colletotrichum liriopes TaxID=708192 RepID=A0AA37LUD8_9PEZI|nr:hypothetical protein ColLi_08002 [Colletotrichum liriopes]
MYHSRDTNPNFYSDGGLKLSSLTPFTEVPGCSRVKFEVETEVATVRGPGLTESSSHALFDT